MSKQRITATILIAILVGAAISLFSCSNDVEEDIGSISITNTPALASGEMFGSSVIYTTIHELAAKSDIIVIGQIKGEKGIFNSARVPTDPSKPDPYRFHISKIFVLEVERYVLGDGNREIFVTQHQGYIAKPQETVSQVEIEQAIAVYAPVPLRENTTYLMFLRRISHSVEGYTKGTLFTGTANPWLFEVSDENRVLVLCEEQQLVEKYFPPQTLEGIVEQIKNPSAQPQLSDPYPAPEGFQEALPPTPYP